MFLRRAPAGILCTFLALSGCGGGGGDDGATPGNPGGGPPTVPPTVPATPAVITFSPAMLTGNQQQGLPATHSLRVDVSDPSVFTGDVYALVVDPQGVLNGQVQLAASGPASYTATLHTSATLASGRHQGQFEVRLCRDIACAAQYPGSPVALPYDLTVTQTPLRATAMAGTEVTAHAGGTGPADVQVSLVAPPGNWTASTTAEWLQIVNGTGNGPGMFTVHFAAHRLAPGLYTDKATVRTSDGQSSDVFFSLNVLPMEFSVTGGGAHITAVNGAPIAEQSVAFDLGGRVGTSWNAASDADWLTVTPTVGTTPAQIALRADPSRGALASGTHTANVRLSSPGATDKVVQSTLTLVRPSFTWSTPVITLGGPVGRDDVPQAVDLNLNTGSNTWPWRLQTTPNWLVASANTGMVDQTGSRLMLAPAEGATPQNHFAVVTAVAQVNGDTVTAPITVNLNRDQRRLVPSEWAVGFASTPLGTTLRRTLKVRDSFGKPLGWSARSSAAWLTVTPVGSTADDTTLELSADPALLPDGAVAEASVTLDSATSGVQGATIRVGLWKNSTAPTAVTRLPGSYRHVVADHFRPHVYAHGGGSVVDIYHAYTAQKIGSIAVPGGALAEMVISPDSTTLYALNPADRTIAVLDIASRTQTAAWSMEKVIDRPVSMLAIRPSGVDVILLGNGTAYARGRVLPPSLSSRHLAASADGKLLYAQHASQTSTEIYAADYSDAASGGLMLPFRRERAFASDLYDVAFDRWSHVAYLAASNSRHCTMVDAATLGHVTELQLPLASSANNVEVTSDGRALCGFHDPFDAVDLRVYSIEGYLRTTYRVAAPNSDLQRGQLVVTPDGMVVVALTTEPAIAFQPIGR